ncbi:MAG: hypothetical protein AAFY65_02710 [Pseudomonadota bacterium]
MTPKARLTALLALAHLRADKSALMLAKAQGVVDELGRRHRALRDAAHAGTGDISEMVIQDRHDQWREEQLFRLSIAMARAEAQAQPFREAHGRDVARAKVLEKLIAKQSR